MMETEVTATPKRHPRLGLVAEVAGIIDALICVIAVVGVLLGAQLDRGSRQRGRRGGHRSPR